MTKSKGLGRGGKRKGAGRAAKQAIGPTPLRSADLPPVLPEALSATDLAKRYADLAVQTLAHIAGTGTSEAARVAASNAILDRALGRPRQDGVAEPRDKTASQSTAIKIGGRFAPRPPPSIVLGGGDDPWAGLLPD